MRSDGASMVAAILTALAPMIRHYGGPGVWRPHPAALIGLARRNVPLAAADAIEWGTRRLDLFILGQFTSPTDRKSVVWGKSVSVRVDLGGRRIIKKKKKYRT